MAVSEKINIASFISMFKVTYRELVKPESVYTKVIVVNQHEIICDDISGQLNSLIYRIAN